MKINVSFCVAYDWYFLQNSLPPVYDLADKICLSIDKDRISWTGQPFTFDNSGFKDLLKKIDVKGKIHVYEENFHLPGLAPMENEVRQRNMIADFIGRNEGWHIQLDTDEYLIGFKRFVDFLQNFKSDRKVNICCPMINLYKQIPEGMLWIKPHEFSQIQYFPIATRYPQYEHGRLNGYFNVLTDHPILHQSWARKEGEIWEKLNNWGHAKDFDVEKHFLSWKNVNFKNFQQYHNFHFLYPKTWPSLALQSEYNTTTAISSLDKKDFLLPISKWDLKRANSIWFSRIKKLIGFIIK